jgi:hypothetical protein
MADYIPAYLVASLPNYARPDFSPVEKPTPRKLVKDTAKATVRTTDRAERKRCHARSQGRCEVREHFRAGAGAWVSVFRCIRRASENHHLIGGRGRRNKGPSILAAHRLDVCQRCHADITGKVLVPVDGTKKEDAATVRYSRVTAERRPA